ncbi:MAG: serine/threonine-protein kinase, partial [Nitrososphaerales archaeon]
MIGTVLNSRYRLDAELGQGGMGVVYRGHDLLLGRDVAVKLLSKAGLGTEGRARLLREAQAVAKLNHPNIVTLYDAGEADGSPFIVMELLSGVSLFERKPGGTDELVEISRQVCAALDHAHGHGVIHRDLKPENVILTGYKGDGDAGELHIKLTDFGLARSAASRQTTEGGIVGTVYYIAPEQAMGRELDGRADLYSLGVMMYELAAGRLPFAGEEPLTVISQHLHAPPVPPSTYSPDLPAPLESLIMRLLGKQPEDRPASAAEVEHLLERIARKSTDLILAAVGTAELSPLERLVRGRLVGRDAELAEARTAWQNATGDAANDYPHVLLIAGETGVGKTPFVRALRALAEVSRGRWLHGECYAEGGAA